MAPSLAFVSPPVDEVLAAVLDVARRVLPADAVAVWRLGRGQWRVRAHIGLSETFVQTVVKTPSDVPRLPIEGIEPRTFEDVRTASVLRERLSSYDAEGIRSIAVLPLMIDGQGTGTLVLYYRSQHRFTPDELSTARALGQTVAAALTAAALHDEQRRTREWATFLDRASTALAQSLDLTATAQTVVDLAVPLFADSCAIHVPGEDGEVRLAAAAHVDPEKREPMLKLAVRRHPNRARGWGRTITQGTVELFEQIDETQIRQALGEEPELRQAFDVLQFTSQLSVPMMARGRLVGAITFALGPGDRRYSGADAVWAEEVARRCALAIDNAVLFEAAQQRETEAAWAEQRAKFLAEAGAALANSLDYDETLRTIVRLAVPRVADWCALDIVGASGTLERLAAMHVDPAKIPLIQTIAERYGDSQSVYAPAHVVRTARPVLLSHIPDEMIVAAAKGDTERIALVRSLGLTSYICVPLIVRGGAMGTLSFVTAESGRRFTEDDLRFAEDVASRAALAVENARAYAEVRRANHLKDEFLATLSHELRTPLNAVLGYSRMLRDGTIETARQPRAFKILERNAAMLAQIVDDILDVSRITAGKLRLELQLVDLGAVVRDALAAILPAAEAKGVRVRVDVPAFITVSADADRLRQVIWNLASNAVKFTPGGGRVDICVQESQTVVGVVVQDDGVGIEPEFLPHVFERFRQADSRGLAGDRAGLGLGLSIAKQLVELHGGTIRAFSDGPGRGATFCVELPRRKEEHAMESAHHEKGRV
jgi:signal transduction histidine kinase